MTIAFFRFVAAAHFRFLVTQPSGQLVECVYRPGWMAKDLGQGSCQLRGRVWEQDARVNCSLMSPMGPTSRVQRCSAFVKPWVVQARRAADCAEKHLDLDPADADCLADMRANLEDWLSKQCV